MIQPFHNVNFVQYLLLGLFSRVQWDDFQSNHRFPLMIQRVDGQVDIGIHAFTHFSFDHVLVVVVGLTHVQHIVPFDVFSVSKDGFLFGGAAQEVRRHVEGSTAVYSHL